MHNHDMMKVTLFLKITWDFHFGKFYEFCRTSMGEELRFCAYICHKVVR